MTYNHDLREHLTPSTIDIDDVHKYTRIEKWANGKGESWHFGSDNES